MTRVGLRSTASGHSAMAATVVAVPDRPWVPSLLAGLAGLVLVLTLVLVNGGGISSLVHGAPPFTNPVTAPDSLTVRPGDQGFDGQFYYRLSVSPRSTKGEIAGVRLDLPALRSQRILYPTIVWAVSGGGRPTAVPWAMVLVNLAAISAVGAIGGALAISSGRHALWGLAFAMYPGFVYSIGFDLAEVLAAAFLLAGLLFARRRRWVATAVFLSFAVLTRETTAIVPISLGLAWLWDRRQAVSPRIGPISRGRLMAGIVPLAIAVGWQLDVRARWGQFPLASSGDKNLRFPFAGLADTFGKMLPPSSGAEAFRWLSLGFVVGVLGLGFVAIRRSTAESHEKIALVAGTILLTLLSPFIWGGATSFMRATTESCLLAILVILGAPRPNIRHLLIAPIGVIAAVTAASEVAKAR